MSSKSLISYFKIKEGTKKVQSSSLIQQQAFKLIQSVGQIIKEEDLKKINK
jgi:hypothetical protein